MEQTYTIYRSESRRTVAAAAGRAPAPVRLLAIALVFLAGWILIHRVGTTAAAQAKHVVLRPRSAIAVLVLNGNGTAGAAGKLATRLLNRGYQDATAMDATITTYARSVVLYRRGWAGEADRLAQDAHIHAVAPLDGRPPTGAAPYGLLVIVGH